MARPFQGTLSMMKSLVVFGVIAAACSSSFAAEAKKHNAPVVKATTMSDAQMDKVTAGAYVVNNGVGVNYHSNVNFHAVDNGFNGRGKNAACAGIC
jgi:hypothetical protein